MARFSARLIRPSRVNRVGMPSTVSTRWARPIMLPRLSGSGWTCETNVTEVVCSRPSRKRSERRITVVVLPFTAAVSALRRAMAISPPTDSRISIHVLYKFYAASGCPPSPAAAATHRETGASGRKPLNHSGTSRAGRLAQLLDAPPLRRRQRNHRQARQAHQLPLAQQGVLLD